MAKTSLQKSHSKVSNAKLTLICLIAAIAVSVFWIGLASFKAYDTIGIILLAVGTVVTLFTIILLNKFSRE